MIRNRKNYSASREGERGRKRQLRDRCGEKRERGGEKRKRDCDSEKILYR